MSWARGTAWFRGKERDVGYAVRAKCDHPGCKARIDRGLSFRCGDSYFSSEYGCGGFFCARHRGDLITHQDGALTNNCSECTAAFIKGYSADGWDCLEGEPISKEESNGRG